MLDWIKAVLSNKGEPSTKRMGHFLGLLSACASILTVLGILIGLSIDVPELRYFDVYSALLDSLYIVLGIMITGGVFGYVSKKEDTNGNK